MTTIVCIPTCRKDWHILWLFSHNTSHLHFQKFTNMQTTIIHKTLETLWLNFPLVEHFINVSFKYEEIYMEISLNFLVKSVFISLMTKLNCVNQWKIKIHYWYALISKNQNLFLIRMSTFSLCNDCRLSLSMV